MNNNYPLGAEYDNSAPYNEPLPQPDKTIEAWASNTLSKNDTLEMYDLPDYTLDKAWKEQHFTAKEALDFAAEFAKKLYVLTPNDFDVNRESIQKMAVKVFNACEGWHEDEFEVVIDTD